MNYKIGEGITLKHYLQTCQADEDSSEWMIFNSSNYSLNMMVYPVTLDNWDIDDDEYIKIESEVLSHGEGYGNLMNADQLVDIIENLKMQKANYSESELEEALNYYSEHDAFININKNT